MIRHALTDAVVEGVLGGRREGVSLNAAGRHDAETLAERLRDLPITAVYSSPLERAAETAGLIAGERGVLVTISDAFNELDAGDWTEKTFASLQGDDVWRAFNGFRSCTRIPGGEVMAEVQARVVTGLGRLREAHPGECIAVVSHADVIKAAIGYYAGIPIDLLHRIEISPASVSVVRLDNEHVSILGLNTFATVVL